MQFVDLLTPTDWLRICTRGAVVTRWASSPNPVNFPIPAPEMNAAGFEKNIPFEDLPADSVDVIDGYRDLGEVGTGDGSRSAVLAPWSNRIRNAKYTFEGKEYDLAPGATGLREALHGFACNDDFAITHLDESFVEMESVVGNREGYPWPIRLVVSYGLRAHSVDVSIRAENISTSDAPVTLGIHPYFRYRDGNPQGTSVFVPAKQRVQTDSALIPLAGADAFVAADAPRSQQVNQVPGGAVLEEDGVTLHDLNDLDDAYTDLLSDEDGSVTALLRQHNGDVLEVTMLGNYEVARGELRDECRKGAGDGVVHLFTGEPLSARPRQAIAIESCQAMTDAFNRTEHNCVVKPGRATELQVEWRYSFA